MKRKKLFILCSACALLLFASLWYVSTEKPTIDQQLFAIGEDGSIRELESERRPVDDFQLSLETALKELEGVNEAFVSCGREGETAAYHVTVWGQIPDIESVVLSYLEQLNNYSVSNATRYDSEMTIELVSK